MHYAVRTTDDPPVPLKSAPVTGYWKMFEKGPDATEPINLFEQMAFGIASQIIEGDGVLMKLNALPDREIRIERVETEPFRFRAKMLISGREAELTDFYVFAEPGFLMPKVKYLDIHGHTNGEPVTERILK